MSDKPSRRANQATSSQPPAEAPGHGERRLRALIEKCGEFITIVDAAGRVLYDSPNNPGQMGYPAEEMIGRSIFDLLEPAERARVLEKFKAMVAQPGASGRMELRVRARDGSERILEVVGTNLLDDPAVGGVVLNSRDITERKRAEEELFQTNQRLAALMDALPVGVSFSDDATCHHITGNPTVLTQFETRAVDNLSASATDHNAHGRQVRYFRNGTRIHDTELPLQRAVADNRVIPPMELEVELPSGRRWFAEASAAPIRDRQGNVTAGVAVTVDITERKRAEAALRQAHDELEARVQERTAELLAANAAIRESEERYRNLVEMSPDGIGVAIEGKVAFVNQAGARLLGASRAEELLGQPVISLVHPQYRAAAGERIRQLMQERKAVPPIEEKFLRMDGSALDVESVATPVIHQNQPAIQIVFHALTERKQAEAALRQSEQRLQALVASLDELVFESDQNGTYLNIWTSDESLLARPRSEMIGRRVTDVLGEARGGLFVEAFRRVIATGRAESLEYALDVLKGHCLFLAHISPIRNSEGSCDRVCVLSRDISERKALEREILEISNREQQRIGQDLHDSVCQQLAGLTLLAKTLEIELARQSSPQAAQAADIGKLLQTTLAETRGLAQGLCPTELQAEDLVAALRRLASSTEELFRVSCALRYNQPIIATAPNTTLQLYRIAQEAIGNAIRHGNAKSIRLELDQDADALTLRIRDDGRGLPDRPKHADGMGLRIMQYRAAMLDGSVRVERAGERGTIVTCRVPTNGATSSR